ncbi:undecaprenyldiphospho-muramoylpentapeptide beta-N-acetylglucosaminyltransferase [Arthrobacter sp. 35W]|uniref:undecaprenyldiphospho-muramoylpentapeptide beta-N-acetylglucosaminyltransferase n=1 Tax=Arthrobacter sp. 35W TaxID=1132441 RepID=UPI000427311F|nr:undecaprenyldiphospho-muramoylpentapeptide beta-N-acetylglucosaminyltransferase [Arthrobacter sp. 35W]
MSTPSSDSTSPGSTRQLSVVLAGGGSAGHVSPLLAIADAVKAQRPEARLVAVGTADGMESRLVPAAGYRLATIDKVPLPRRPSMDLLRLPGRMLGAIAAAKNILRSAEADVLVGVGGYVCTPMYLAARSLGIPMVVHEANSRPGLANRVGALFAAAVGTAFAGTKIRGGVQVGMPMRTAVSTLDRAAARAAARDALGLDPDRPALIATGGSLGALSINRAVAGALADLAAAGVQVLHITGRGKSVLGGDGTALTAPGYRQVEYVDDMESVYAAADVLLCRAGAGTVCEVAAVGLPAVFVPLPIGNGEQALNARELVAAEAALLVSDAELSPAWIAANVLPLCTDAQRRERMAAAAAALGIRDADVRMAQMVLSAAGKEEK